MDGQIKKVFVKRKLTYTAVIIVFLLLYFGSSFVTQFHLAQGVSSFPQAFAWIAENLMPDELAMKRLPKIVERLLVDS